MLLLFLSFFFAVCLQSHREHENQRPQTTLIEAQLKHANALILFSLGGLPGCGISFDFCMHRIAPCELSQHVFLSADGSVSTSLWAIIWGLTLDVYFGRNPIMHSCPFPLVRVVPLHVIINQTENWICTYGRLSRAQKKEDVKIPTSFKELPK